MFTKIFITIFILSIFLLTNTTNVSAVIKIRGFCFLDNIAPNHDCDTNLFCKPTGGADPNKGSCEEKTVESTFGKIQAPSPLAGFLAKNPTGGGAISQFLSNGITLIYSVAGVVLVFMMLWGAFEWMTSGGDKEKMSSAQKRIISAIVGILLFGVAFAIIQVLGTFTGFKFFN